jgi:hypothetical protein
MDANTWAMFLGVQTENLHATNLLHTMALYINGLHLKIGLPADSVHGKIRAKSL